MKIKLKDRITLSSGQQITLREALEQNLVKLEIVGREKPPYRAQIARQTQDSQYFWEVSLNLR